MGEKSQDHQEQEANPQLKPNQDVQDQAPVHQQASPAAAAQRAIRAPGKLTPKQVLALQKAVGNRAVQRLVQSSPGVVQRHLSPSGLDELQSKVSKGMIDAHGPGHAVGSSSNMSGDKVTIEAEWLESS